MPLGDKQSRRADQRPSNALTPPSAIDSNDPALSSYPRGLFPGPYEKLEIGNEVRYIKIVNVNPSTGETVYSSTDIDGLKIVTVDK